MPLEKGSSGGLDDPAHLVTGAGESAEGREGVHDISDGREADQEHPHPRILARSALVSWSFGSPTMATRPA